ncbi:hypothetical protein BZG36_04784 [Bifiguratus adelaidae]|uniref:Polysaccharide lyase 14 domain-containing protein n=1 Tax=Bifiguratus adelaidae TaxID=1938954 RepID=A0A261XTZ6_9FUNG|nr:hypothetical protein BZG36_04784 [Bifiguratus adelaidae]
MKGVMFALAWMAVVSADPLSSLAGQLNLSTQWNAQFPSGPISSSTTAAAQIAQNWGLPTRSFFGSTTNLAFVADPFSNSSGSTVLQVQYPQGSYNPGSVSSGAPSGGTEFYSSPFGNQTFNEALLTYSVGFAPNFPWVLGGKLPGLYGGDTKAGCSGGSQSTGSNCWSMRLMWRAGGAGEAYAYIPSDSSFCSQANVICNPDYGKSLARGSFTFTAGSWTQVQMHIKLNDPSQSNGILQVWANGNLAINMNNVKYHTTNMVLLNIFFFSTFFGGNTQDYATTSTTYTYYKDISMAVGPQVQPSNSGANHLTPGFQHLAILTLLVATWLGA